MRQFRLTKCSFLVHSTTRNASYIHTPSHDLILELLRTSPNDDIQARARGLKSTSVHKNSVSIRSGPEFIVAVGEAWSAVEIFGTTSPRFAYMHQ